MIRRRPRHHVQSPAPTQPTDAAVRQPELASDGGRRARPRSTTPSANELRQDPSTPLRLLGRSRSAPNLLPSRTCSRRSASKGLHQIGDTRIAELRGPVGQPRQLRPEGRQGADGPDRRLLRRQRRRRPRRERQVGRQPRPTRHRLDPLLRRRTTSGTTDPDGGWRVASSQDLERTPCDGLVSRMSSSPALAVAGSDCPRPSAGVRRHRLPGHRSGDRRLPDLGRGSRQPRRRPASPETTARRTRALARPATGIRRAQGLTKPPAGPVPCTSEYGLLVERLQLLHQAARSAAAGRAIPAGKGTSRATAPSTAATSRRPASSSASGRRTRRRTPARGRHPARSRSSRSTRWTCGRSTSASRPSPVRTASASSACRCGCGPRTPTSTPSVRSRRRRPRAGITVTATARAPQDHLGHGRRHRGRLPHGRHAVQGGVRQTGVARLRPRLREVERRASRATSTPSPRPRTGSSRGRAQDRPGPSG